MTPGERTVPWSTHDENRLLLWSIARKPLKDFARATGRTPTSVRLKLMRLRRNPLLRPPEFSTSRDAAAPRVPSARGPNDTPPKSD